MANLNRLVGPTLLAVAICLLACTSQGALAQDTQQPESGTPTLGNQTQLNDRQAKADAANAAFATTKANTPIVLAGSDLAHKYYLLQVVREKNNQTHVPGVAVTDVEPVVAADVVKATATNQLYEPLL